jgi:hypothetical protein
MSKLVFLGGCLVTAASGLAVAFGALKLMHWAGGY